MKNVEQNCVGPLDVQLCLDTASTREMQSGRQWLVDIPCKHRSSFVSLYYNESMSYKICNWEAALCRVVYYVFNRGTLSFTSVT